MLVLITIIIFFCPRIFYIHYNESEALRLGEDQQSDAIDLRCVCKKWWGFYQPLMKPYERHQC